MLESPSGSPLQPGLETYLAGFSRSAPAQALDRLVADQELLLDLQLHRYEGKHWRRFGEALAAYGVPVIRSWGRSGEIFRQCARKGLDLSRWATTLTYGQSFELANETVAVAIAAFKVNVLMANKWDPSRGATLKTFFIGQCVLQFPNTYRNWLRDQDRPSAEVALLVPPTPRASIEQQVDLSRELPKLTWQDPRALKVMMELGHQQDEIAVQLGISRKAIESRIARVNQRKSR